MYGAYLTCGMGINYYSYAMRYLIGVDEAGRAPLAGPVSVGAVIVPEGFDVLSIFPDVKDSKLLSHKKRVEIYRRLQAHSLVSEVRYCVRYSSHAYIDEHGITKAVRRAVTNCVRSLAPKPEGIHVQLDGLLKAPTPYSQETIIRGDFLIPLISLASVVAKVRRDRKMVRLARHYPGYSFEVHKGYPTPAHKALVREKGLCEIHRRSYCARILAGDDIEEPVEVEEDSLVAA
jgi:ribonuclease HII